MVSEDMKVLIHRSATNADDGKLSSGNQLNEAHIASVCILMGSVLFQLPPEIDEVSEESMGYMVRVHHLNHSAKRHLTYRYREKGFKKVKRYYERHSVPPSRTIGW